MTIDRAQSPITLEGDLDSDLNRGMWLIKWILAIPHVLLLVPLFAALLVSTLAAGVAILFTGRFPRPLFDFNVGVMRWGWRVSFYAFGAIGTDQYPPFTLADADYPARLDVAYPERLSRPLVLVKSWLLALPQLLIVGLLTEGWVGESSEGGGIGFIGLLVLVAGFALLFTGRYPKGLFDLVMGLQRWTFRVLAYVFLMTDEYPPFRLDLGGSEPQPVGAAA